MKQGSGTKSNSARKIEPRSEAINPGAVSQIGNHVGEARAVEQMNQGRGYKAPPIASNSYPCGSQGKH